MRCFHAENMTRWPYQMVSKSNGILLFFIQGGACCFFLNAVLQHPIQHPAGAPATQRNIESYTWVVGLVHINRMETKVSVQSLWAYLSKYQKRQAKRIEWSHWMEGLWLRFAYKAYGFSWDFGTCSNLSKGRWHHRSVAQIHDTPPLPQNFTDEKSRWLIALDWR